MNERLAFTHSGGDWRVSGGGIAFSERSIGCWNPASGDSTGSFAVDDSHEAEGHSAQPHRLVEHCVQYRRGITGRGVELLQDLGSRGLLLQGFTRLGQQSRVLRRDDRLRREAL